MHQILSVSLWLPRKARCWSQQLALLTLVRPQVFNLLRRYGSILFSIAVCFMVQQSSHCKVFRSAPRIAFYDRHAFMLDLADILLLVGHRFNSWTVKHICGQSPTGPLYNVLHLQLFKWSHSAQSASTVTMTMTVRCLLSQTNETIQARANRRRLWSNILTLSNCSWGRVLSCLQFMHPLSTASNVEELSRHILTDSSTWKRKSR